MYDSNPFVMLFQREFKLLIALARQGDELHAGLCKYPYGEFRINSFNFK